jgi:hypothetical protein
MNKFLEELERVFDQDRILFATILGRDERPSAACLKKMSRQEIAAVVGI